MQRKYAYHEYEKALLHYSEFGKGERVLLCFHGFGQKSSDFKNLELALQNEYTIYSFDLFYHGNSFWKEKDKPLSKEFWKALMQKFLEEKNIDSFSLLGFSMGGKFSFATLECFPDKVRELTLLAPDGIKTNFWYSLATYPSWTRKFFRSIILRPGLFFKLIDLMEFLKIIDGGILRFARTQMQTREQRRRIYYSWVVFKDLYFDLNKIADIINKNNIKLTMFLGEFDKIITEENMQLLLEKVKTKELKILKAGHSNLIEAVAENYASQFNIKLHSQ